MLQKEPIFCGRLLFWWFFRLLSVHGGSAVASASGF
jgi:hypothetical protein